MSTNTNSIILSNYSALPYGKKDTTPLSNMFDQFIRSQWNPYFGTPTGDKIANFHDLVNLDIAAIAVLGSLMNLSNAPSNLTNNDLVYISNVLDASVVSTPTVPIPVPIFFAPPTPGNPDMNNVRNVILALNTYSKNDALAFLDPQTHEAFDAFLATLKTLRDGEALKESNNVSNLSVALGDIISLFPVESLEVASLNKVKVWIDTIGDQWNGDLTVNVPSFTGFGQGLEKAVSVLQRGSSSTGNYDRKFFSLMWYLSKGATTDDITENLLTFSHDKSSLLIKTYMNSTSFPTLATNSIFTGIRDLDDFIQNPTVCKSTFMGFYSKTPAANSDEETIKAKLRMLVTLGAIWKIIGDSLTDDMQGITELLGIPAGTDTLESKIVAWTNGKVYNDIVSGTVATSLYSSNTEAVPLNKDRADAVFIFLMLLGQFLTAEELSLGGIFLATTVALGIKKGAIISRGDFMNTGIEKYIRAQMVGLGMLNSNLIEGISSNTVFYPLAKNDTDNYSFVPISKFVLKSDKDVYIALPFINSQVTVINTNQSKAINVHVAYVHAAGGLRLSSHPSVIPANNDGIVMFNR